MPHMEIKARMEDLRGQFIALKEEGEHINKRVIEIEKKMIEISGAYTELKRMQDGLDKETEKTKSKSEAKRIESLKQ